MNILIEKGRVICPKNQIDQITDIAIADGKFVALSSKHDFIADQRINAEGQWIIPGLVDTWCRPHMKQPMGATILHEAQCALARGITTLMLPPESTTAVDMNTSAAPKIFPMGALTEQLAGDSVADLTYLRDKGCIAFSQSNHPITNLRLLKQCYEYAASFDLLVVIQASEPALAQNGIIHEGIVSTRLGLPGIPSSAETVAIAQHLMLIEQTGIRAHFTCLTTQGAVELIRQAKDKGLPVTADCSMIHLHLTEMDLMEFDPNCYVLPPLRALEDQNSLMRGINDSTIDAICSAHRPLDAIHKLAPIGETTPGMSTLDIHLSLGLRLVQQNKITLTRLIDAMTYQAARCFNLELGTLTPGHAADLAIISPESYWTVTPESLISKGKNCYLNGWELPGQVNHTIVNGQWVYGQR